MKMQILAVASTIFLAGFACASPVDLETGQKPCTLFCPEGEVCVTLPRNRQVCALPGLCGGIAGFACADGYTCIDDPRDSCDIKKGGADCGGICIRKSG